MLTGSMTEKPWIMSGMKLHSTVKGLAWWQMENGCRVYAPAATVETEVWCGDEKQSMFVFKAQDGTKSVMLFDWGFPTEVKS
jgi:hypothetical protein